MVNRRYLTVQDLFNVHSTLRDDRVVHFSGYEARVPKRVGARRRRTEAAWPCMRAAGFSNANDEIKLSINEGRRVLSPPPLSNDALFVVWMARGYPCCRRRRCNNELLRLSTALTLGWGRLEQPEYRFKRLGLPASEGGLNFIACRRCSPLLRQ